ncbi:MAG: quinone oxidoreductase, partial [Rhizobiales bacterium]|nr:quinone oxidoreductase [Hyphomicrobiales bacterium]
MKAIVIEQSGGPDAMKLVDKPQPSPKPGELLIRHAAIGLNYIDTYHRSGLYPVPLPSGIGLEAAGVVKEVGAGVKGFKAGDRIAYGSGPIGAYSEMRVVPANRVIKIPKAISDETAAGMMLKGMTVRYLLRATYKVKKGETILLHAAAGGVGLLLCQIAKQRGARVIGTVSSEEKAAKARSFGCDEMIFYRREDVAARVKELTGGEGVQTVFDSVGADTFNGSLKSLRRRGVLVGCGTASGPFPPIDAMQLVMQGSVYFTRPAFADYYADPAERAELAAFWFDHLSSGRVKVEIGQRYALEDCVQAHRDLEAGKSIGSSVSCCEGHSTHMPYRCRA